MGNMLDGERKSRVPEYRGHAEMLRALARETRFPESRARLIALADSFDRLADREPAKVFEDRETPGQWRVEWFDDDGRCELEFSPAQQRGGKHCGTPCRSMAISEKSN